VRRLSLGFAVALPPRPRPLPKNKIGRFYALSYLFAFFSLHPLTYQSRMGRHGPELFEVPACSGLPGVPYHGVRRNLRGPGSEYRRERRYIRHHLDLYGVHGAFMLHTVQNGQPCKNLFNAH